MSAAETTEAEWVPGDPLYDDPHVQHQRYLYNLRDEPDWDEDDDCHCPDAAKWPNPSAARELKGEDELTAFIRDYHEWQQNGEPDQPPAIDAATRSTCVAPAVRQGRVELLVGHAVSALARTIGVHL